MPATKSLRELAEELGLGTRQIENLVAEGMPHTKRGKKARLFPWPLALRWYVKHREQSAQRRSTPTNLKTAQGRRATAEAALKELELAKAEGEVIAIGDVEREWARVIDGLRARLVTVPGKYAPAVVGCRTIAEAMVRLEGITAELLSALAATGDDVEADDPEEPEPAPTPQRKRKRRAKR